MDLFNQNHPICQEIEDWNISIKEDVDVVSAACKHHGLHKEMEPMDLAPEFFKKVLSYYGENWPRGYPIDVGIVKKIILAAIQVDKGNI